MPQEKSTVAVQRKRSNLIGENAISLIVTPPLGWKQTVVQRVGLRVKANEYDLQALGMFLYFPNGNIRRTLLWEPINSCADRWESYAAHIEAMRHFQ